MTSPALAPAAPETQLSEGVLRDRVRNRLAVIQSEEAGEPRTPVLGGDDWPSVNFARPRYHTAPTKAFHSRELGLFAVYLAQESGLLLDPWEEWYLLESLRLRDDDKWAALECGLCVPRQNGKGSILEARELVGLFVDEKKFPGVGARLAVHTAHEAKTAHEGFERLEALISQTPKLRAQLRGKPRQSEGGEVIRLRNGRRIRFRTRTSGGGRGLSGDLVIFDEAMILMQGVHEAVWPIITARPNPQIWYAGSAVDKAEPLMDEHGIVFSRVRKRGIAGDEDLLYAEWSLEYGLPDEVPPEVAADPEAWAQTNPGLDVRLSRRIIAVEQRSLSHRGFVRERLGVGDWPDPDASNRVIGEEQWADARVDETFVMLNPVCLAVDVSPDRSRAAIGVAGKNASGKDQVEVVARYRGTARVLPALLEFIKLHGRRTEIMVDGVGSAASLIPGMEEAKLNVVPITGGEHARGCGMFYDGIMGDPEKQRPPTLNHLGDPALNAAVSGAVKRPLGERWAWDRKNSMIDISPLVAVTLALYGLLRKRQGAPGVYGAGDLLTEGEEDGSSFDEGGLPPLEEEDL